MDYEKLYKESLKRAKNVLNCKAVDREPGTSICEYIFPELQESEDEKIRKRVLFSLQKDFIATKNSGCSTKDLEDCIAWLEKQGSSSVKWQKNTPENKPPKNHSVLMKTVDGIAEGEWDGKYWHQYRWSTHIYDSNVLYWIELHDLDGQGKQKQEWNEEDDRYSDAIYKQGEWIGNSTNRDYYSTEVKLNK